MADTGAAAAVVVRATGLRRRVGRAGALALDGVDCEVRHGELLAVAGPSGSGKTTLLHCLSGIAVADEGCVEVDGVDLAGMSDDARADLRRDRMGFCFQTRNLLPALTVRENVALPLVMAGRRAADVTARTDAALAQVGIGTRAEAMPADLSGGEQARAAIARAVVAGPDVVWADEPTGALDRASAASVLDLLRRIAEAGSAVVVCSHDPEVVGAADRVLRLRDGRVEA